MGLELIDTLFGHQGRVWNVKWNPAGTMLGSCGEDKNIRLWSKSGGGKWKTKMVLEDGHQKTVREIAWSMDGKMLASASFDATTAIWDNGSGKFECIATLEGHENEVKSVGWSKSGHLLATCSRDKSVWVWDVADDEFECAAVMNAHSQDVKKVLWHPHIDVLASASYDNTVKLYREDSSDSEWINFATLKSHESTVWSMAFDSTGTRLATCSDDKTVKIWKEYLPGNSLGIFTSDNEPTWKCVATLSGYHNRPIYDISWNWITGNIATACSDNSIHIFSEDPGSQSDSPSFSLLAVNHNAHDQDVNSIAWHPTEPNLLASASDNSTVRLWNLSS